MSTNKTLPHPLSSRNISTWIKKPDYDRFTNISDRMGMARGELLRHVILQWMDGRFDLKPDHTPDMKRLLRK